MLKIGAVEKRIYKLREESPLIIPQLDPDKLSVEEFARLLKQISGVGIEHIAVGGSLITPSKLQEIMDIAVKDFDFSAVTYPTNSAACYLKGKKDKTAIYWMSVMNAENPFFLKDVLVMNSAIIKNNNLEPIPTAYVFDDRGSMKTSNWLSRAVPIPRDKPDISLAVALASEYLGMRFYIMAGGSGCKLTPPAKHVELISRKSNLFIIPTSGIVKPEQANDLFRHNADAIHIGALMEKENGANKLKQFVDVAKKYPGKQFDK